MSRPALLPIGVPIVAAIAAALPGAVNAAGVRAGVLIRNVATASYAGPTGPVTLVSNAVELRVDEVIDVAVAGRDAADGAVRPGAHDQLRSFTVTNGSNAAEAFALTIQAIPADNGFTPAALTLVLDTNGNGVWDPGIDQPLGTDPGTPTLDPDAKVTVFVLATIPGDAGDGQHAQLRLTATARKGSGRPGLVLVGRGEGGGDALIGATTARADALGGLVAARAGVALVKSASVRDPLGGAQAISGALITYRLAATATGSATLRDVHVTDAIPAGAHYQPGTLTLDGAPLSDAADTDAGSASATGIDVALGDTSPGGSHAVEFTVKID